MLTVCLSSLEIGILKPDRNISVECLTLDAAGRAQRECGGLSRIDIRRIGSCGGGWKLSDVFQAAPETNCPRLTCSLVGSC
jgi:hypothetical protein